MTTSTKKSVRNGTTGLHDRPPADFVRENSVEVMDDGPIQSLITAALLTTTAFRLRDQDGLTFALRLLVDAIKPFETERAKD